MTAVVAVLVSFVRIRRCARIGPARRRYRGRADARGLDRTYQVHVPTGLDHPAGLVINLHGAGMTGGDQAAATNYDAIADQHGFVVAYPDGIDLSWADRARRIDP